MVKKYIYDPKITEADRSEWPFAVVLSIQALNSLPLRNLEFSREQIMFRFESGSKLFYDPYMNQSLTHLDNQVLTNVLKYLDYNKKSGKPPKEKFFQNQIVYIRDSLNPTQGENRAFKNFSRGPLKITQLNNDRQQAICYCPETKRYFSSHFKDLIRIKNPNEILPIFSKNWSDNLLEVKYTSKLPPKLHEKFTQKEPPN